MDQQVKEGKLVMLATREGKVNLVPLVQWDLKDSKDQEEKPATQEKRETREVLAE